MTGTTRFLPTYPTMPHMRNTPWIRYWHWNPAFQGKATADRASVTGESVFEGVAIFLNHRVGQDFAGNAIDFRLSFVPGEGTVEFEFEVLALAHVCQTFVAHLFQRAFDGLALWIEDALLERNINVGLHECRHDYTSIA